MKPSSQKSFSYFSRTYKNRFDFFFHQKIISFKFLKTDLIFFFLKTKDFVLFNKHRFEFSLQKPLFFTQQKEIWFFFFFLNWNQILLLTTIDLIFLNKEEDAFINKFVWFSFVHMYNISFITCIKGVHRSQESRRPNSVQAEWVLNTFSFRNLASEFRFLDK